MEILNYILSSIIVMVALLLFVKILINPKIRINNIRVIVIVILSLLFNIIAYKFFSGLNKTIICLLFYIITVYHFYNIKFKKPIVVVIYIIYLVLVELTIFTILSNVLTTDYLYNEYAGSLVSNIIVYGSMLILTILLKKTMHNILNIKLDHNKKIIIISTLTLISILVFFFDIISNFRIGSKTILYIVAIITFVTILIFLIYEESKNVNLKIEYEKLLEFMQTYEIELENERVSKHEHKNELIAIKSKLIDNDSRDNIIGYIDELLGDESKFSLEGYTQFQYLPPNGIKALFYFKISEARNKGINTNINIIPSVANSSLKDLNAKQFKDLGVLIGVYLDNAIEASLLSEKKVLGIEIYNELDNVEIIISNSYVGNIEVAKIGKEKISTKGKNRGHGLLLVKQTLSKNNKLVTAKEITSNLYIQTIVIKK